MMLNAVKSRERSDSGSTAKSRERSDSRCVGVSQGYAAVIEKV